MLSTQLASSNAPLKPCHICNCESCVVIPSIATPQHLCLLHYYTTGAHRSRSSHPRLSTTTATAMTTPSIAAKKKSSSLLVESQRMDRQLPKVQELFAEAFIELQREIGEESARIFQSAASSEDPLALLLDPAATSSASRSAISRSFRRLNPKRSSKYNISDKKRHTKQATRRCEEDSEGGFLREAVLPERLRKLQNPDVNLDGFANKYSRDSPDGNRKRPATGPNTTTKKPSNPYQKRRQKSPTNPWNQILDSCDGENNRKKGTKSKWEDIEKEMICNITSDNGASSKTCSCGSTDVEINGNVTSRNNDMMKGEVWGMKNRSEMAVERCHCRACGKTWNEE